LPRIVSRFFDACASVRAPRPQADHGTAIANDAADREHGSVDDAEAESQRAYTRMRHPRPVVRRFAVAPVEPMPACERFGMLRFDPEPAAEQFPFRTIRPFIARIVR